MALTFYCRTSFVLVINLLAFVFFSFSQVSISGPTCVTSGVEYQYTISGSWNSGTNMQWCVTGGTITGYGSCRSGTPLPSVRIIFTANGTVSLTSSIGNSSKSVSLTPTLQAGTIATPKTQTIAYNTIPAVINCSVASGGNCSPTYSYQWQQSPNNVSWTDMSGSVSQNLTVGAALTQTTYYRRKVTETVSSSIGYSDVATVFVNPALGGNSTLPSTINCTYNASPGQITGSTPTGGLCGSYGYQWQQSSDNVTFTNISGATSQHYTPGALTVLTYYRRLVTCGSENNTSNVTTVNIMPQLNGGTITSANQTISYNSIPSVVNASVASGGNCSGSYSYQWQISTDNVNFTDISGATSQNLTLTSALTQTRYYRRKTTCNSETKYTGSTTVTVAPQLNPGSITSGNQSIDFSSLPTPVLASAASGGNCGTSYVYQWQQSANNSTFVDVSAQTAQNLTFTAAPNQTLYYRRKTACGSEIGYTSSILVTLSFYQGILNGSQTISAGGAVTALTVSNTAGCSPGTTYTYVWERSINEVDWQIVSGASTASYAPPSPTVTTYYRVLVSGCGQSLYTNNACIKVVVTSANILPDNSVASSSLSPVAMPTYPGDVVSSNMNYVRTRSFVKPGLTDLTTANAQADKFDVSQTTEYFDGLGRSIQGVIKNGTAAGKDLISTAWYDDFGRVVQTFLPYTDNLETGNFRMNPNTQQPAFYNAHFENKENFYYAQTRYESSPLNRAIKQNAPGKSWNGSDRGVRTEQRANRISEDVKIWTVGGAIGSVPSMAGVYKAGELIVTEKISEHGSKTIEYMDKGGQVILKKVQISNLQDGHAGWLCTYLIYDELSRLRYVLQPKAVEWLMSNNWNLAGSTIIQNEQCFRYEYDSRGRIIIKKVPGADEIAMVYDARDRLIMSQDGNLRTATTKKWLVTQYDAQNRPIRTGLWNSTNDRAYHQGQAQASTSYPNTATGFEMLTETYYDGYTYTGAKTYDGSFNIQLQPGANRYPDPTEKIDATRGMTTGTKVKILGTGSEYLLTTTYFDAKGRVSQTLSDNIKGGVDIISNQFDYGGRLLSSYSRHQKNGFNLITLGILTKIEYDHNGRQLNIKKNINGGAEKTTVEFIYDERGMLKTKQIGKKPDGSFLETQDFKYTIRGWLNGINRGYANPSHSESGTQSNRWFGMELAYDNGFTKKHFNGDMAGMRWKSTGDDEQRALGYDYDNASRILKADFNQLFGSSWQKSDPGNANYSIDFSMKVGDGINPLTAYDANGNIKAMKHWGLKVNSSLVIDEFTYAHKNGEWSNQLIAVTESSGINTTDNKLGDFTDINRTQDDYAYDVNGNLIYDRNKRIATITYNHLNLPINISITKADNSLRGTISYVYDALGNKVQKVTTEGTYQIVTTFINGIEYQYTSSTGSSAPDTLQIIEHEEGRIRSSLLGQGNAFVFDYFLKDHLGNVRMVLSDEVQTDYYPAATLEGDPGQINSALNYEKTFYDINNNYIVDKSLVTGITNYENNNGNPPPNLYPAGTTANTTAYSQKLYKLNAATNKIGLGITLKVMAGDRIDVWGKSYYFLNGSTLSSPSVALPVIDLLTAFAGGGPVVNSGKEITGSGLNAFNSSYMSNYLNNQPAQTATLPKAFINYILFDENFKFITGGFSRVGASGTVKNHNADLQNISVAKSGYLYIYASNETQLDVFFDNLQVVHTRGALLEETHYYPFGLTMAGISSKAAGKQENYSQKFQAQRFDVDLGLNWYQFKWRNHDPQIGKFIEVDPLSDKYAHNGTYAFSENKVTTHVELEGLEAQTLFDELKNAIKQEVVNLGKTIDGLLSVESKTSTSTEVVNTSLVTQSVGSTTTTNTSSNFAGFMTFLTVNNTANGYQGPYTKTEQSTTVDTKTEVKLGPYAGSNKTSINVKTGEVTNETSAKAPVKKVVTVEAAGGKSSGGKSNLSVQASTGTNNTKVVVKAAATTSSKGSTVTVGVGAQQKIGKTTFTQTYGISFHF